MCRSGPRDSEEWHRWGGESSEMATAGASKVHSQGTSWRAMGREAAPCPSARLPFPGLQRAQGPGRQAPFREVLRQDPLGLSLDGRGEGAAPVHAHPAGARVGPVAPEHPERVAGRRAGVLGARELLRAGGRGGGQARPGLQHVQRVALRGLGAARVPPRPGRVEVHEGDLVPPGQELRVGRRVGAGQEGPLGLAQADEEAVLRGVVHVVAVLQRPLSEPAALRAEEVLKGGAQRGPAAPGPEPRAGRGGAGPAAPPDSTGGRLCPSRPPGGSDLTRALALLPPSHPDPGPARPETPPPCPWAAPPGCLWVQLLEGGGS